MAIAVDEIVVFANTDEASPTVKGTGLKSAASGLSVNFETNGQSWIFKGANGLLYCAGFEAFASAYYSNTGALLNSTSTIGWSNGGFYFSGTDAALGRASAKVIELNNGTLGGAGATFRSVPLTPTQIAANQNDYAPGVAMLYRLSSDASRNITGLSCSQVDGQVIESICNVGSFNIVLTHQDAASTAANRFICTGAANITLAPNEEARAWYDGTTSRWRVSKL